MKVETPASPAEASARLAAARLEQEERGLAVVVAWILVLGVVVSALVVAGGLGLLLLTGHTGYHNSFDPRLITRPDSVAFPTRLDGVLRGVLELRSFAIIELGLLLLIATPVLRVAASVLLFLAEGDRLYAAITALVLLLLLVSIFWVG